LKRKSFNNDCTSRKYLYQDQATMIIEEKTLILNKDQHKWSLGYMNVLVRSGS
jgi:hypothetical protein